MQPKDEIEKAYEKPDPWGFQTHVEDQKRKARILEVIAGYVPEGGLFQRALDIGAGEGWITKDLPAIALEAFEISKNAKSRLPETVKGVEDPSGFYDLIIATGVLYGHYDCREFFNRIERHAKGIVLTCNIKAWELREMSDPKWVRENLCLEQIHEEEFPYREFYQKLRVFKRVYTMLEEP